MATNFNKEIELWAKKFSITINKEPTLENKAERSEIDEVLFCLLNNNGIVLYSETGTSPTEYLPSVIGDYLGLLSEKEWTIDRLITADNWQSADVTLKNITGDTYQFTVEHINNCDWVPSSLADNLLEFSRKYTNQTLMTFYFDDPYLVLALSVEASQELALIIKRYTIEE